jgi:hypothetical protein
MDKTPTVNQEITRARALVAELKLNAHERMHTANNLCTVHSLMLEEIQRMPAVMWLLGLKIRWGSPP